MRATAFFSLLFAFFVESGEVFLFVLLIFLELFGLVGFHEVFRDVVCLDSDDAWDLLHEDDLDARGNIFPGHRATIARSAHLDVNDAVAESD